MYKPIIEQLNTLQEARLSTICIKNSRLSLVNGPATKQCGLYWIYTKYTDKDFLIATPSTKKGSVDFNKLIKRHALLSNVCSRVVGDFRLVYNGIGGVGPKGHGGLRERILEEFRGGKGTGSFAINDSSLKNLQNWRVSYVLWSEIQFKSHHNYSTFSEVLERLWRIHYGWPILCTK